MRVTFIPIGRAAEAKPDETLLDVARRASVPLGNSCGGVGVCARCRVRVVEGRPNLTPPTSIETRVAAQRGLDDDERLACQAVVKGNCTITAPYW
jgi:ferredoxin, 2Fe-2S